MDFAVTVKIKEIEKFDKYLDYVSELKMQWILMETVIPPIVGVLGTFP